MGLGWILDLTGRRFCVVVCIVLPFLTVVLEYAVVCIKGYFRTAAGATASALVGVLEVIFDVVADPIAWNATNTLYEFFVVVLVKDLVLILVPAGRWFAASVFYSSLLVIVVVLVLLVVLDGTVVVVVVVAGNKVDFRGGAVASSPVVFHGVIFVVVVVPVPIAWNATDTLYEFAGIFLCHVLIVVLAERRFGATVSGVDTKVIVPWVIGVVVIGIFFVFVFGVVGLDFLSSVVVRLSLSAVSAIFVVSALLLVSIGVLVIFGIVASILVVFWRLLSSSLLLSSSSTRRCAI